jgi:prolyl-tRNA synthetase
LEKAEIPEPEAVTSKSDEILPLEEVHTPDVRTIEEVCAFLKVTPADVVKTLIFNADGKAVAVLVRGDEDVNEIKVKNYLGCDELELAGDDIILAATGSHRGFAGAVGIKTRIVADYSLIGMKNMVMGANRANYHVRNVNFDRDFRVSEFADLRAVREGDVCPRCRASLTFARGIEVGHVFKLGTKYSKALKAVYLDKNGKEQVMIMGCYGIGVTRTVAAAIEQYHDDDGIIWPVPIAPFQVIITPVNINEASLCQAAEELYRSLTAQGIEVLLDDRDERAGVKFKDADLIGIPFRVTIGPKKLAEGQVEIKNRKSGEVSSVDLKQAADYLSAAVQAELDRLH